MRFHYALISDSKKVTKAQLYSIVDPLQENLRHAHEIWRDYLPWWAQDRPSVVLWDDAPLPSWGRSDDELGYTMPVFFVDGESRSDGTLGFHYAVGNRPASRVYVEASSGLNNGRYSLMEIAAHEVLEPMCNPFLMTWDYRPGYPGQLTPREICDAVQDTYDATTADPEGRPWQLANFVTPAWYGMPSGLRDADGSPMMDYAGTLTEPGTIGPEGYLLLRDTEWNLDREFGAQREETELDELGKPEGRTRRIIAWSRTHAIGM